MQERADELRVVVEDFIGSGEMDEEAKRKKYLALAEEQVRRRDQASAVPRVGQSG